jgi:uncharacterized protein YneF (UPF0154 family)
MKRPVSRLASNLLIGSFFITQKVLSTNTAAHPPLPLTSMPTKQQKQ